MSDEEEVVEIEVHNDEGILAHLNKFLLISFFSVVIVPSIAYFILIYGLEIHIPFEIAVYLMLFSGLTNMEIWLLSVWTARSTMKSVNKIKEEADKYKEDIATALFGLNMGGGDGSEDGNLKE